MKYISLVVFLLALVCAAIKDVKTGNIPNGACVCCCISSAVLVAGREITWVNAVFSAVLIGIIFFIPVLFNYSAIGGGDIKLLAACSACVGLYSSLIGALLALGLVLLVSTLKHLKVVRLAPYIALSYIPIFLITYF